MPESHKTIPNDLVGVAGVHHIVSELTMRWLVALPTIRNTAGIDIVVTDPRTKKTAALQVKTSQKRVSFWPTSRPAKCLRGKDSFYIFVRYLPRESRFQAFMEQADSVVDSIAKTVADQQKKGRKVFPCWMLPKSKRVQARLEQNWLRWRPVH